MSILGKIFSGGAADLVKGVGGVIDDLHTSDEEKLAAENKIKELISDYETKMEANITDRWKADMNSDSWLSKNVRPLVLVFLVVWTEGKKTWTIKNGIKQTISKLDTIKKEVFMPLCCPNCGKVMKKRLDKPNYKIHKKCFDCVVEFEHKLKIRGEYDSYIKKLEAKNSLDIVDEMESYLLDAINTSNSSFVSEDGVIERWVGGVDKVELTKQVKEATKTRREHIEKKLNDKKRA